MLELKNLVKTFGKKVAVDGISLSFGGGFNAITGRSGSGKSTLLKMAGLMLKPDDGEIIINGKNVWSLKEKERDILRNQTLGFVFQDYSLEPHYTVYENIELPLLIAGQASEERKRRVEECLEFIGMRSLAKQKAKTLSGGEQQRVAVAHAIANNPKYLLADEPCGNLDKENGDKIIELFRKLTLGGVTVVMVTHNPEDAAKCDRIVRLLDGKVEKDERI